MKKILIALFITIILGSVLLPVFNINAADDPCAYSGKDQLSCSYVDGDGVTRTATYKPGGRCSLCCKKAGLMVCGWPGCECRLCDFFILIDHLIDFAILKIAPIAAVLLIIIGGVMFMISSGDPGKVTRAKNIIISVVMGLAIIYSSYMIVGLILKSVGLAGWTSEMYGSWINNGVFEIDCGDDSGSSGSGSGSGSGTGSGASGSGSGSGSGAGSGADDITTFCNSFTAEEKKSCNIYTRNKMSECANNPCHANSDSTGRCYPERNGSLWRCIDVN